jgi:hypothetical protein
MAKIVVGSPSLTQSLLLYPGLELAMLDNIASLRPAMLDNIGGVSPKHTCRSNIGMRPSLLMYSLECLFHVKANYSSLRIFCCACWPHLRPFNSHMLEFRSKQCVFLGYSNIHKGFKCLDLSTVRTYIPRDVVFDENIFPFSTLQHNTNPRLREEILLLPPLLINNFFGGELTTNHMTNESNATNSSEDLQPA